MPISPWFVGQTFPVWSLEELQTASAFGTPPQPLNLQGSTITLHYQLLDASGNPTGSDIVGVNNGVITNALGGLFTFAPAATDTFVTNAGSYMMQWKFDYGSGHIIWGDPFPLTTKTTN